MATETLNFKIGLSGTFWNKRPAYSILLNDSSLAEGTITVDTNETQYIEFTAELDEDKQHTLAIRLENKTPADTVENEDKTAILKDMLLNIDSISIDDIELGTLVWTTSTYTPDDAQFPTMKECVNLGWNGTYAITFSSPFYIWLLENM